TGNILVIDLVNAIDAEAADLLAAAAHGTCGAGAFVFLKSHCWFTSCLNFCVGMDALERQIVAVVDDGKVIGIPGRIAGDRLDVGRAGGGLGVLAGLAAIRGAAPIAAAGVFGPGKIDVVGDDLHCGAVVAVFVLVLPGLDA